MNYTFHPVIKKLFSYFKESGHELYLVGGCVRDLIMERDFNDYDMTTSATPEEMIELAQKYDIKVIPTGIKHGTLTFVLDHVHVEITTYRCESEYENNRRPKEVYFTRSLKEDVQRRDFTINSIALNEDGIVDYYQGAEDINNKVIRAVGDPDLRFKEDALRIMRALRFSFQLHFAIEENTWKAIQRNAYLLNNISKERIRDELCKMLLSDKKDLLVTLKESKVLEVIIPEYARTYDFEQHSSWHIHDLFMHHNVALNATSGYPLNLKIAILLHDLEKVTYRTYDALGNGHFMGHAPASAALAQSILRRLKFDNKTIVEVYQLIKFHDYYLYDTIKSTHKFMYKLEGDFDLAHKILKIQLADNKAKNKDKIHNKNRMIYSVMMMLKDMERNKECFRIKDLDINGHDLIELGYKNEEIGLILEYLLKQIINQQNKNKKEILIKLIGGYKNETMHRK